MYGTSQNKEVATLVHLLFEHFESLVVDPEIASKLTGRSKYSLRRDRVNAVGIPYTKVGKGKGSDKVQYSIYDIAVHMDSVKNFL